MDHEQRKLEKRLERAREAGKLEDWETCCRRLAEHRASLGNYEGALEAYREELLVSEKKGIPKDIAGAHRMIGEMCCTLGHFEEALVHVNKYLDYAKTECDTVEEQRAFATIGRTYFCWAVELQQVVTNEEDRARLGAVLKDCRKAYMKSLYICEQELRGVGNRERQEMKARLLFNLGLACEVEEEMPEALNYIARAAVICKQESLFEDLHRCYISQSSIYLKQENTSSALVAVEKAMEVAKKLPNTTELTVLAIINKADIYFSMANYPGARTALKKAFKLKTPNEEDKKTVETNLRRAIFLCETEDKLMKVSNEHLIVRKSLYERLGDACCSVKNFKHAIKCYLNMLECGQKLGQSDKDLQPCYVSLCQTYRDNKQYDLALMYAKKELQISKNVPKEAARTHIGIGELLEMKKASYFEISDEFFAALQHAKDAGNVGLQASALRRLAAVQKNNKRLDLARETEKELAALEIRESDDSDSEQEDSPTFGVNLSDLSDSDEESSRPRASRNTYRVTKNEKGETPLHVAAIRGDVERAKRLLNLGHPVKERDLAGWTPLHEAANHGHLDMVKLLVEAKANVNDPGGRDCGGVTPLHDSASCGHFSIIQYLLENGASVAALTDNGETPLDCLKGWRERVGDLDDDSQEYSELEKKLDEALKSTGFTRSVVKSKISPKSVVKRKSRENKDTSRASLRRETNWGETSRSRWRSASPESEESNSEPISLIDSPPQSTKDSPRRNPTPRKSVADYRAAINAIRKRPLACEILKPKIDTPLLNEDDFVDDWLDDDSGAAGNEKKMKRKVVDLVERDNIRHRRSSQSYVPVGFPLEDEENRPPPNEPNRKRAKIQTSLADAGFETVYVAAEQPAPPPPMDMPIDFPSLPSPPMSSVSDHAVTIKVRVNICHHTLLIAVDSSRCEDLTVRWLAEEAAKRYRDLEGAEPQLLLKTRDGAVIASSDPLSVVLGEDIESTVLSWKVARLPERYRDACSQLSYESESGYGAYIKGPDTAVLGRLESCVTSRVLDLGYFALTTEELKPVFQALKYEKSLQAIDLSGNVVGDTGLEMLSRCMENCTIANLNLRCNNITAAGFNQFCDHLGTIHQDMLSNLRIIDVSYNALGDASKSNIEKLPSLLPNLNLLKTDNCDFPS